MAACRTVLLLMLYAIVQPLQGGVNQWTNRGPESAAFTAIAFDPVTFRAYYAATNGAGVFRSTDKEHFFPMNEGLASLMIQRLAASWFSPGTLYAASTTQVFQWSGEAWTTIATLPDGISSVAADDESKAVFVGTGLTVYRLRDGGYDRLDNAPASVSDIGVLHGVVFATNPAGVWISRNGGDSWSSANEPVVDRDQALSRLTVERSNNIVYVARHGIVMVYFGSSRTWRTIPAIDTDRSIIREVHTGDNGVLVTTENGIHYFDMMDNRWVQLADPHVGSPAGFISFYGGLFVAGDRGLSFMVEEHSTWRSLNAQFFKGYTSDVVTTGDTAFATGPGGLFRAVGTDTFAAMAPESTRGIAIASDASIMYVATDTALLRSTDQGRSLQFSAHVRGKVYAVLASASRPNVAFFVDDSAVWKTIDGGLHWNSLTDDLAGPYGDNYYGGPIAVDPNDESTVYLASNGSLYRADATHGWSSVLTQVNVAHVIVDRASRLYGVFGGGYIQASDDRGATWRGVDDGDNGPVTSLALDPFRNDVMYAAAGGAVYRTKDAGKSWLRYGDGLSGAEINALTVRRNGDVFAATAGGVYEYTDDDAYLASAGRYQVSLRSSYGNFLSAGSDRIINANATSEQLITLYDANGGELRAGDVVHLRINGDFVAAEGGGANDCNGCESALIANRERAAAWESFVIQRAEGAGPIASGDPISLVSSAGNYVSAENGGYNGCHCDSPLHANRTAALEWETFVIRLH